MVRVCVLGLLLALTLTRGLHSGCFVLWESCQKEERGLSQARDRTPLGTLTTALAFPSGRARSVRAADAHPHPHPRVGAQPAHGVQSSLQPEPETVSARPGLGQDPCHLAFRPWAGPLRLLRTIGLAENADEAPALSLRQHTFTVLCDFRNVTPCHCPHLCWR